MADQQDGNGYLRQGEFRRWADGVDRTLASINARQFEHTELLAVLNDRKQQNDRLKHGVIVSAIGSALAVVTELFHLFVKGAR